MNHIVALVVQNRIKIVSIEKLTLLISIHLIPFTCHIALARIAIIMLKSSGESGHPCLA